MSPIQPIDTDALQKARGLVKDCVTDSGFLASPTPHENYRRIWSRDGIIIGLAALMSEENELVEALGKTLKTLAECQGPHGEIPSNVGLESRDISYGGTAGRVDANLWFVIGVAEYVHTTGDTKFARNMIPVLDKVIFLLGAWEFNNRGFIYVPAAGDWADEYIHSGYILYDQLLYLQALRSYRFICTKILGKQEEKLTDKIEKLQTMIQENFWIHQGGKPPKNVYHEILFEKGRAAADHCTQQYWLPFFSPHGYGYRFDSFANVLASLLDIADTEQRQSVDQYIEKYVVPSEIRLLPAFYPVIRQDDKDWEELQVTFSYDFKNKPYEFHNGGLWPMLTGFYAADLARRGNVEKAKLYLFGIGWANRLKMNGHPWGFPEFINGENYTAGGNADQCWSGSAYLMAHYALQGKSLFSVNDNDYSIQ